MITINTKQSQFAGTPTVDESEIDSKYKFSYIAVRLVMWYQETLLTSINKIGDLPSGAYGVYKSNENQKIIPDNVRNDIFFNELGSDADQIIANIPRSVLLQYFPNLNSNDITGEDTVRVNVSRILSESNNDDWWAVREIAATIVHEATHEIEREETGDTSESGPKAAESSFTAWAENSKSDILNAFPDLKQSYEERTMQEIAKSKIYIIKTNEVLGV